MVAVSANQSENEGFGVLRNVAEDLKTPLLRIVSGLQLNRLEGLNDTRDVETVADAALRLLDSYILSTQCYAGQQQLPLEPVSVQAAIYDSSQYLAKLARLQGYEAEFRIQRNIGLAMAHQQALMGALTGIAYSLLYNKEHSKTTKQRLIFRLRTTRQGIDAGLFSEGFQISAEGLQSLRALRGSARQLTPDFAHGSSAGIVIADKLLNAMGSELRPARFGRLSGLSLTLVPSRQLSLI